MVLLANPFPWYISRYALLQACVKWRFFIIFVSDNEWNLHVSFCVCWLFHHQKQIEMVRLVCDVADKVLQEAHKFYRLETQQGPLAKSEVESKNPFLTLGQKTSSIVAHTNNVHELLECLVCTNSMYLPIHQVPNLLFSL
jgi:hypothetical protein